MDGQSTDKFTPSNTAHFAGETWKGTRALSGITAGTFRFTTLFDYQLGVY